MIMVGSAAECESPGTGEGSGVAGIITIAKGHDAAYPWKQIGAAEPDKAAGRGAAGYYLSPAERGGEPPGIWTGEGVAELGLLPGGVVDRAVFEPLYGRHLDPRDPSGRPGWAVPRAGTGRRRRSTRRCWLLSRRRPLSAGPS